MLEKLLLLIILISAVLYTGKYIKQLLNQGEPQEPCRKCAINKMFQKHNTEKK
jgi:hypothetical protein